MGQDAPSYLVKEGSTNIILGGYQNLATFQTVISRLSDGKIKPRRVGPSLANVMDFVKRYKSVYPVEIEVAFALDRARTNLMIAQLERERRVESVAIGDGCRLMAINPRRQSTVKRQDGSEVKIAVNK